MKYIKDIILEKMSVEDIQLWIDKLNDELQRLQAELFRRRNPRKAYER